MNIFFRSNKSLKYYIIIICIATYPAMTQAAGSISLKQSIEQTLGHNRTLLIAVENVKQAKIHVKDVQGDRFPRVDVSTGWVYSNSPLQVFAYKLQQQSISSVDFDPSRLNHPRYQQNYQSRLGLSLPLFAGGALQGAQNQAERQAQAAEFEFEFRKQQQIYQTIVYYMQSLQYAEQVKYSEQSLHAAKKRWYDAQALQSKGMALASDVMNAHVYVLRQQLVKDEARHAYQTNLEYLALLMGMERALQQVSLSQPDIKMNANSLDDLLLKAKKHRLDLKALGQRLHAQSAQRDIAYAGNFPQVELVAEQTWNSATAALKHGNAMVGVNVRMNLFNGGSDHAKQRRAEASLVAMQWQLAEQQQRINHQVHQAYRALQLAKNKLLRQQQVLQQTTESLRILSLRYEQGLETTSQVLDAQVAMDDAQVALLRAQSDLVVIKAALLLAAGLLDVGVVS